MNPYHGTPRPELDKAWRDLLEHNNIRLSGEELHRLNRSALALHDGSGDFGQVSTFHHFHCILSSDPAVRWISTILISGQKFLRQVLRPDYYDTNILDREEHVDHCVDDTTQALMCDADTPIVKFDWRGPEYRLPWLGFHVDHTCVD